MRISGHLVCTKCWPSRGTLKLGKSGEMLLFSYDYSLKDLLIDCVAGGVG